MIHSIDLGNRRQVFTHQLYRQTKNHRVYNKFTLQGTVEKFGLHIQYVDTVLGEIHPKQPSQWLTHTLRKGLPRATRMRTEKARSELIIAPILLELQELRSKQMSFFSGVSFDVDKKQGLSGRCDFLICRDEEKSYITAPIIAIVEAKNDNLETGLGQCAAEMYAAQLFNQRKQSDIEAVYGVVTTGVVWQFLKLKGQTLFIERIEKTLDFEDNLGELLGIFLRMIEVEK
jgi:hypothetical protein